MSGVRVPGEVELRGVGLAFPDRTMPGGRRWAVQSVDCRVAAGEFCSIIGPSGCGKSTLLSIVAGLLSPTVGTVAVGGQPVRDVTAATGYMFQKDTLVPWRTALGNVLMPLEIAGRRSEEGAMQLLRAVGLETFAGHFPRQLSGGMRKRVQLARLLAQDPDLLLMDEPFGALDAQTKLIIQEEFLRLWEPRRQTVLFVTHDLTEAITLSDRILLVSSGPGTIRGSYDVPIERPRDVERSMNSPAFRELFHELWNALREERGALGRKHGGIAG